MSIKKQNTKQSTTAALVGIAALSFASAPLLAASDAPLSDDPTIAGEEVRAAADPAPELDAAADELEADAEALAEDVDVATDELEADAEALGEDIAEGAETTGEKIKAGAAVAGEKIKAGAAVAGDKVKAGTAAVAAAVTDAADDDETASMIQQQIAADARLGLYQLDVIEIDGRYQVTGMIDQSEDYATLQRILGDLEGVDGAMVDNNVVVQ